MKFTLTLILSLIVYAAKSDRLQKRERQSGEFLYQKNSAKKIKGVLVLTMRGLSDTSKTYAYRNGILLLSVVPVKDDDLKLMTDPKIIG